LGATLTPIDFTPFTSINELMFFGPFLAERDVSVGAFLDAHPDAGIKLVRDLIIGSRRHSAADAYRALYQVKEAQRSLEAFWQSHDALVVPTVGTVLTIDDVARDPLGPNFNNGYYTNFANPLGLAAIAIPNAVTQAGVPYGITVLSPPGREAALTELAEAFLRSAS
jgi:allophanate hydrolase/aspartyl-tRNA(Asn)/glutamyl-tRNA(Gln) amidotransferase subunit A